MLKRQTFVSVDLLQDNRRVMVRQGVYSAYSRSGTSAGVTSQLNPVPVDGNERISDWEVDLSLKNALCRIESVCRKIDVRTTIFSFYCHPINNDGTLKKYVLIGRHLVRWRNR